MVMTVYNEGEDVTGHNCNFYNTFPTVVWRACGKP
jgi:hypothetical protein